MPRPEAEPIKVEWDNGLVCYLPLTTARGKVRVKREHEPLATRAVPLTESDILEWQISYKGGVELARLLQLGYEHGLISGRELEGLESELRLQRNFFSDQYSIQRIATRQVFQGFKVIYRKHPILHRDLQKGISIEVEFKPQQRGVRAQPMVYLFIPVGNLVEGRELLGRTARPNEVVRWRPSSEILFELVRAFALASRQHRDDMLGILKMMLR